ncbi:MAG: hypothetical protein ABJN14_19200 [Paracoccaceae bacterium]
MLSAKQSHSDFDLGKDAGLQTIATSVLVCCCAGALYGWSALIVPLQATFAVTTAQTGFVFSLAIVSFTAAVIITPRLPFHVSHKLLLVFYGLAGSLFLVSAAHASTFQVFLLCFSLGFGAASGGIYITALGIAGGTRRHVFATPIMVASFGLGGAIFGPVWRQLDRADWGMAALYPLAVLLCIASLIALASRNQTEPIKKAPVAINRPSNAPMMRLIWSLFALGSFAGLMVLGLGAKMMSVAGAGAGLASFSLAGVALGNTGGRLSVAWFGTWLRADHIMQGAMMLTLLGLTLTVIQHSPASVCFGLFLVATGYGVIASGVPVLTREVFGADEFQHRFALIFTAWGTAGFLAPWVGGALYDLSQSFTLPLIFAGISSVLFCVVSQRIKTLGQTHKAPGSH